MMYAEALMRRAGFLAGLAILAAAISSANAQGVIFHGIPASVTSSTPQNPTPGIPASVTSATPVNRPFFVPNPFFTNSPQVFHHHRHFVPVPVPVPVYYPFYSYYPTDDMQTQQQVQPEPVVEIVETPAPTIFENRPDYQVPTARLNHTPPPANTEASHDNHAANQDNSAAASQPAESKTRKPDDSVAETQPTTILVFRDGHELEIGNYAIVGDTLYNLTGSYKTHKIMLADLDLEKTIKVNEDRGYDFRLPEGN